jgi:hypothetical protein
VWISGQYVGAVSIVHGGEPRNDGWR